jgi:hypothetical protein
MNTNNDIIEEPDMKPTKKGAKKGQKEPTQKELTQKELTQKELTQKKASKGQKEQKDQNEQKDQKEQKEQIQSPIVCPEGVIDGRLFTKEKRQELYGRVAGGGGSKKPEEYQREQITLGTGRVCKTTQTRINWRKNEMKEISQPMREEDGFDYTENFDGKQEFGSNTVWVNLKSVVGTGGSQTRTLRDECYPFVNAQLLYLIKTNSTDCFFANIFDGDEAASKMKMFHYLLGLPEFAAVKKYVYVGDLKGYFEWVSANV